MSQWYESLANSRENIYMFTCKVTIKLETGVLAENDNIQFWKRIGFYMWKEEVNVRIKYSSILDSHEAGEGRFEMEGKIIHQSMDWIGFGCVLVVHFILCENMETGIFIVKQNG